MGGGLHSRAPLCPCLCQGGGRLSCVPCALGHCKEQASEATPTSPNPVRLPGGLLCSLILQRKLTGGASKVSSATNRCVDPKRATDIFFVPSERSPSVRLSRIQSTKRFAREACSSALLPSLTLQPVQVPGAIAGLWESDHLGTCWSSPARGVHRGSWGHPTLC